MDAERLLSFHPAEKKAIIMYGFEFDSDSHRLALDWCERNKEGGDYDKNLQRVKNMKSILHKSGGRGNNMSMRFDSAFCLLQRLETYNWAHVSKRNLLD